MSAIHQNWNTATVGMQCAQLHVKAISSHQEASNAVACVMVEGDRIYDFVEFFNKERIDNSTSASKSRLD